MQLAASHLRDEHIQGRFCFKPDEWLSFHPKHYTTLALIHYKERHTDTAVISVDAKTLITEGNFMKSTKPKSSSSMNYHSRDITELFVLDSKSSVAPKFLLIEGAPGIGKTVLSKEIAYQWAKNKLLIFKSLVFLILLRDPNLKNIKLIEDLLKHLLKQGSIAVALSKHLFKTKGADLTLILDGYDEMSEEDRKDSFIADIINRITLPECSLVITSRPTASLKLHNKADRRVEVLGFTKEDRLDYIQHALEGSDAKIQEVLQSYLQSNCTIDALCYVPINLTILLSIFKDTSNNFTSHNVICTLPKSQTELYQKFILMRIMRFLIKNNEFTESDKLCNISELCEPHSTILLELSLLAFITLQRDAIVFYRDDDDIKQFCPFLTKNYNSWNGFGLLNAARFGSEALCFNFLHYSIQEYLAAYHIASLSRKKQTKLLQSTFWDIRYLNMWIMYVGITGGDQLAWKHFLSGRWFVLSTQLFKPVISKKILNNKIKFIQLFQCFAEVGGNKSLDNLFDDLFKDQTLDFSNETLLPKDVTNLGNFILRSNNKHWKALNLSKCNIGDTGCDILLNMLGRRDTVIIDNVNLTYNNLHIQSVLKLPRMFKLWRTSEAIVHVHRNHNDDQVQLFSAAFLQCTDEGFPLSVTVNEYHLFAHKVTDESLYNILVNKTSINGLHVYLNDCTYLLDNKVLKLQQNIFSFHITYGKYSESFLTALVKTIDQILSVFINISSLSDKAVDDIANVLLQKSSCDITNSKPSGWMVVGANKCLGNTNIPSEQTSSLKVVNLLMSTENLCSDISISPFEFVPSNNKFILSNFIMRVHNDVQKFCIIENNTLFSNRTRCNDIIRILSSTQSVTCIFISNCKIADYVTLIDFINKQKSLSVCYIFETSLGSGFLKSLCHNVCPKFNEILVHSTDPSCTIPSQLLTLLNSSSSVVFITKDTFIGNNPTCEQLSLSFQLASNIKVWKFLNCQVEVEIFYQITRMFSSLAINLIELHISNCDIRRCEVEVFLQHIKHSDHMLNYKKLTVSKIQELTLNHNHLQARSSSKVFRTRNITNLKKLDVSHNNITDEVVSSITSFLLVNINLEEVNLSHNNLQISSALKILNSLESTGCWTKFIIYSRNKSKSIPTIFTNSEQVVDTTVDHTADYAATHGRFRKLNLSYNNFQAANILRVLDKTAAVNLTVDFSGITASQVAKTTAALLNGSINLKGFCLSFTYPTTKVVITFCKQSDIHKCNVSFSSVITDNDIKDIVSLFKPGACQPVASECLVS